MTTRVPPAWPASVFRSIMLKDSLSLRIHRSCLINIRHFRSFEKQEGGRILLSDGSAFPFG